MNPDPKPSLKVFLCHAHPDADKVRALYARLKAGGVDAWLDKENIIPGQDWEMEIRKAVRESDIVVVCLSKQFSQKGYRQNEVRIALEEASLQPEGEIFIIPARLEECNYLESLKRFHGVDLFEERGYEYLMRALRLRADKIGAVLQTKKEREATEEKVRLEAEELTRQESAKEKAEKEAAEKARLEAEEPARQKAAQEKAAHEVIEKAAKIEKEIQRETEKQIREIKRELQWKRFKSKVQYWINIARINAVPNILFLIAIAFAVYMFISYSKDIPILNRLLNPVSQPSQTSAEVFAPTITFTHPPPTLTFTPASPTKDKAPPLTQTIASLPEEIVDDKEVAMRLVPAGEFTMGSDNGDRDEKPVRQVYLDAFYMDKYEVTNILYKACVIANGCTTPKDTSSHTYPVYYSNSEFDEYPVINVDWNMAKTYCEWRGADLPTEAKWEKAARGTDGRTFPWGDFIDYCDKANYYFGCAGDVRKVGSYENGKSPYGIYDMVGNVWEWTADWYSETAYQESPSSNPVGSSSGQYRVERGGSWESGGISGRSANRSWNDPVGYNASLGFRCARNATP